MSKSIRRAPNATDNAMETYLALGELTENDMRTLRHSYAVTPRKDYFSKVYGYAAGRVARRIYNAWEQKHVCDEQCQSFKRSD